jgi:hypothetical protein
MCNAAPHVNEELWDCRFLMVVIMKNTVRCQVKDVSEEPTVANFGIGSVISNLLPPRISSSRLHDVTYKKTVIFETIFISFVVTVL